MQPTKVLRWIPLIWFSAFGNPVHAETGNGAEHPSGEPVRISVSYFDKNAVSIGLTESFVSAKIRYALRNSGLEVDGPNTFEDHLTVFINLWVLENGAYRFDISCDRPVTYTVLGKTFDKNVGTLFRSGLGYVGDKPKNKHRDLILKHLLAGTREISAEIIKDSQ